MKKLVAIVIFSFSSALAAYSPTQLAQLVKTPDKFKPAGPATEGRVNAGFSVNTWQWGKLLSTDIDLQKSETSSAAWNLRLTSKTYKLAAVTPKNKLLAVVTDPIMGSTNSLYSVLAGPFKGAYVVQEMYKDGSGSLNIQTAAFAKSAYKGSELNTSDNVFLLSYPLSGYLFKKGAMCSQAEVQCK